MTDRESCDEVSAAMAQAKAVGDAVLYEGYLLYPYRASAGKNRFRWQWGVLMPPSFASDDAGEYAVAHAEMLLEPREHASLHIRLRCLHAQARIVSEKSEGGYREVDAVEIDGAEYTSWDEAVERELDAVVPVAELLAQPARIDFEFPAAETIDQLAPHARMLRRTETLRGQLWARVDPLEGPFGGTRLRVEVRNSSDYDEVAGSRDNALRHALLATHLVLAVDSGHFLSQSDPPEWARPAAEACVNERVWPVLIGDDERARTMLCSPIILGDNPEIAPESHGSLFDGTEIDEILTLRTMALTDEEKREARATDPRAAEVIDRVDGLPAELLERLHGTVRYLRGITGEAEPEQRPSDAETSPDVPWWDPGADASVSPESDSVLIGGTAISNGSSVTLRPGLRRADAQDMFLAGRAATVRAVLIDVDDCTYIAVTLDDDPAADLHDTHGRYRYFAPEEIEPRSDAEVRP